MLSERVVAPSKLEVYDPDGTLKDEYVRPSRQAKPGRGGSQTGAD
jgi:hypothetical protein